MTALNSDLIQDLERPRGGRWVKTPDFSEKGQRIGGILRNITIEDRTDDKNNVVYVRGTDRARKVYRVIFQVPANERDGDSDEGLRIWDAPETGQSAIRDAVKAAGTNELIGAAFKARIVEAKPTEYSQATYEVKFEPAPKTVNLPIEDDEEPF